MAADLPTDRYRDYGTDFLRRVIDSTHDSIIAHRAIRNADGEIIDFEMTLLNRRIQQELGPNGEVWVGRRLRQDLPGTLEDGRYQLLVDAVTTGEPHTIETVSTFRDGSVHRLLLSAVADGDDVVVSMREITQEYDALAALAESEQRYRDMVEHQAELVCRFLPDTTILFVNEAYARYHGTTVDELIGTKMIDLVADKRRAEALALVASLGPDRTMVTDEGYLLDEDGSRRWQQWTTSAVAIENGRVAEVQAVGIDITARKQAEESERERAQVLALVAKVNQRFIDIPSDEVDSGIKAALADLGEALRVDRASVVLYRPDRVHLVMTHEWCAPGVASVKAHVKDVPHDSLPQLQKRLMAGESVHIESLEDLGPGWEGEKSIYRGSGVRSTLIMPIMDSAGLVGSVGFDVTRAERRFSAQEVALLGSAAASFGQVLARREAESDLRRSERRFRALVEGVPDLLVRVGSDGNILDWRPSASGIDQRSAGNVIGRPLAEVFPELLAPMSRAMRRPVDEPPQVDAFDVDWGGESVASFEARVTIAGSEAIVVVRDVTEQQRLQMSLLHQATHDALTGLANRRLFSEHLAEALEHGHAGGAFLAVLFIDLDQFKVLNDSQGHDVGDAVLRAEARRLVRSVRPGDVVARLGGDEFAVLSHRISSTEEAVALAERVVSATTHPIELDGDSIVITASVGVVVATAESTTASVLRDADAAMYQAKAKGRRRVELFTDAIRQAALVRHQVELDLRRALEADQLELYYQPLWSLATARWVGVEALVRWNHPDRGLLLPGDFLPVADDAGLMPMLGAWVVDRACSDLSRWRKGPVDDLRVWVNLSGDQLMSPRLDHDLQVSMDRHGVDPTALGVEVTETAVVSDVDQARATLTSLRKMGVSVALDDFGTGLSSLTHLDTLPLDVVKLDGTFVSGADQQGRQRDLIDGIVALVRRLGLEVLAERVESAEEVEALRQLGVDSLQGFHLGRPMPVDVLANFLTQSHHRSES